MTHEEQIGAAAMAELAGNEWLLASCEACKWRGTFLPPHSIPFLTCAKCHAGITVCGHDSHSPFGDKREDLRADGWLPGFFVECESGGMSVMRRLH